jgi:YHS domain-containing protein
MQRLLKGKSLATLVLGWALLAAGCATDLSPEQAAAERAGTIAQCPVCRCNADLGCLIVKITDATPRAEYQGRTYYFCSEDCHDVFLKNPAKYAERR